MIACQRHLFDLPEEVVYLNAAYMSPLPNAVRQAGEEAMARKARPWTLTKSHYFDAAEAVRAAFGRLIGASAAAVAIVPAVSYAAAVASANLALAPGKKILLLEEQFPSNVYPWHELAKAKHSEVVTVARPADGDWTAAILARLDASIGLAALPQCHWVDGCVVDLVRVGEALRTVGAALFVDASQSLGVLDLDVATVKPDFMACAGYKWLLGPYSLGFLYVDERYHAGQPLEYGWITRRGADDFSQLTVYRDQFDDGARRFDMGERANLQLLPMLHAALTLLHTWPRAALRETLGAMTDAIAAHAASYGIAASAKPLRACHYLGLRLTTEKRQQLLHELEQRQIYVSGRGDFLRITPHVYNDENDLARLFSAMDVVFRGKP